MLANNHSVVFYDLELLKKPGLVWSPNTCKTRYALNLKNIPYETKWVNFDDIKTVIPAITQSDKRPAVPIIVHNGKSVVDSWHIAHYLEEQFPNKPSLFHGNVATHKFFQTYSEKHINTPIFRLVLLDIHQSVGDQALQDWFRQDRESWMKGNTLEQFAGDANENITKIKTGIAIISAHLKEFPFVTGEQPGWADVALLSHLTFLAALKPEIFKDHVLNDQNLRAYWNRTEYIRNGVASPNL
ncbi:uncharacterized protein ATC70_002144 [Mucor velutinosus]|uniref:GST N-terminal domain-containing protein n=1 Tax=Mucor velutinosus TaxID=708070 RepID=A0AAN7DBR3_9FUNG|nr:hypothetical protein ATC70_002144 [Mucor velutinosus]